MGKGTPARAGIQGAGQRGGSFPCKRDVMTELRTFQKDFIRRSDPWVEIGGDRLTTTAASVSNLQCGASASYEFRVRALADASVTNNPYDGTWGFWSGTSSSILVRCTGASGSAEKVPYATEVASPDDSS